MINELRKCLANELIFSSQAQSFHWNYTGPNFLSVHEFLGEIYQGSNASIDVLAEYIRIQMSPAPCCISDMYRDSTIEEISYIPSPDLMLGYLAEMNQGVIKSLSTLMNIAEEQSEHGLIDYLGKLIDTHQKWGWMLRAHYS